MMLPKVIDQMANSEDPDQTGPLGAFWSGSVKKLSINMILEVSCIIGFI